MRRFMLILFASLFFIITGCSKGVELSVAQRLEAYQSVEEMIVQGELSVEPDGCVVLPDKMKYLSDSGECFIVEYGGTTAIYFYSFRGSLEASKGYLYMTERIFYEDYIDTSVYSAGMDFVNLEKIADDLYFCSTD